MTQPKNLIEVAMPVKEVSAERVRDKSIRHGIEKGQMTSGINDPYKIWQQMLIKNQPAAILKN